MATNPYVNKVQLADGTTVMDITPTTATASDVLSGKYFFAANGTLTLGTNSGGSGDGYVWQDVDGYVHLSDEEGTQPIYDTLNVNASGTFTPAQGHAYNSVVVPSGTAGTPTASKGTVSNHSIAVTPSVTNSAGYITGSTKVGTAVSVSASELVSGTYSVTSSGTKDVTNYASASVPSGSATPASSISGTSATVTTGTNTLTLSKTISNTPTVSAGYISAGTSGNSSVSLTANVTTKGAATITPTTTNQTIASGTYITGTQTISGDSNLVAGNIKDGTTIFGVTGSYSGGGSASNFVQGTFTTNSTTGSRQTITIPYTGNGYPVLCTIGVVGGFYNSNNTDWYNTLHRYAIGWWCMSKQYPETTPIYGTDWSDNSNMGNVMAYYKNSTSSLTSYTSGGNLHIASYYSNTGTPAYPDESRAQCVVFNSNTQMSFYISNTSYGLLADTEYEYTIIYSE